METIVEFVVALHLLGMAAIVGGWIAVRAGAPSALTVLVWGARVQLVLGLVLVAVVQANKEQINTWFMITKLLVSVGVVALAEMSAARARKGSVWAGLANGALILTVANIFVATMWPDAVVSA